MLPPMPLLDQQELRRGVGMDIDRVVVEQLAYAEYVPPIEGLVVEARRFPFAYSLSGRLPRSSDVDL